MTLLYILSYKFFYWVKRLRKRIPMLQKPCRQFEYYYGLFLNRKYVPWLEKHPARNGLNTEKREETYTVSLTSFPARINYVHIAIETLLRQSFKPDRIVLWLAESQFPDRKLPQSLVDLQKRGLTVRFCEDLRSHKKYYYVFQEYPKDNVILVDDDAFYSRDMIAQLVRTHKKYPKDIISTAAQVIEPSILTMPSTWPMLKMGVRYEHTYGLQAFSGQGTLYPAHWYPQELFYKEEALALAASADDMWLQAMSYINGVKTTMLYPHRGFPVQVEIQNNELLYQMNNGDGGNMNDKIWQALIERFKLDRLDIRLH